MSRGEIPPRLRDVLEPATRAMGIEAAVESAALVRSWSRLVGAAIADHAEPTSLSAGVLRIRADSPAWATEIGYLADEIRARANAALGKEVVRAVRVWTGPGRPRPTTRSSSGPGGSAGVAPATAEGSSEGDPEAAFERAFRAWKRRRAHSPRARTGGSENQGKSW